MRFEELNKNVRRGGRPRKPSSGQGFYLVLLICLGIIGVTTFFALNGGGDQNPASSPENGQEAQYIPGGGLEEQMTASPGTKATATATATHKATTAAVRLTVPVQGDIIVDYHMNDLVYSKTLNEWSTHPGIDIAAKSGTDVKAALNGTVASAGKDAQMGNMIVLTHAGGGKTVYANLKDMKVKAGDKVRAGDVIGTVGTSAISESEEVAHLHFEYHVGGKPVDPKNYLTGLKTVEPTP
jgi:murein DD-endopeptidase MepM/ murein hydrolase activator NlpD